MTILRTPTPVVERPDKQLSRVCLIAMTETGKPEAILRRDSRPRLQVGFISRKYEHAVLAPKIQHKSDITDLSPRILQFERRNKSETEIRSRSLSRCSDAIR